MRGILLVLFTVLSVWGTAQCTDCVADPACTSPDGFPTVCPSALPAATAGEPYSEFLTFYLPATVVDPGSGITATLLTVTITSVTGLPFGMEVELSDPDGTYTPSAGQTSGCATLCGTPLLAGTQEIVISVSATVSAFGQQQTVSDSFVYPFEVLPGSASAGTFTAVPPAGCVPFDAEFTALLTGEPGTTTTHTWTLPDGSVSTESEFDLTLDVPGTFAVSLTTTVTQPVLNTVTLSSVGSGWNDLDDFLSSPADPYFVLLNGSNTTVYTSSVVNNVGSTVWTGLGIVLLDPPYTLVFYDDDLITADDAVGTVALPIGGGAFAAGGTAGSVAVSVVTVLEVTDTVEVLAFPVPEPVLTVGADGAIVCGGGPFEVYGWAGFIEPGLEVPTFEEVGDSVWVEVPFNGAYQCTVVNGYGCGATAGPVVSCGATETAEFEVVLEGEAVVLVAGPGTVGCTWTVGGMEVAGVGCTLGATANGVYSVSGQDVWGCPLQGIPEVVCLPSVAPGVVLEGSSAALVEALEGWSWTWWSGGVEVGEGTELSVAASGWVGAEGVDAVGCSMLTDSLLVCLAIPDFALDYDPASGQISGPTGYASYSWTLDGTPLPDATGPVLTAGPVGAYALAVVDYPGCPPATSSIDLSLATPTGLATLFATPNPFADALRVSGVPPGTELRLRDAAGRLVAAGTVGPDGWMTVPAGHAGWHLLEAWHGGRPIARLPLVRH